MVKIPKISLDNAHRLIKLLGVKINKQTLGLILVLIIGLVIWIQAQSDETDLRADYYSVTEVFDGDTIEVDMAGNLEKIRFIGVDTPETNHPEKGLQCYGNEATERTAELIGDGKVRLIADELGTNRDVYDRLLRYVYNEDGLLINRQLIIEGYGFATTSFRYGLSDLFLLSETEARDEGAGLWRACIPKLENGVFQTDQLEPPQTDSSEN